MENNSSVKKKIFFAIFFLVVNVVCLTMLILTEDKSGNISDAKIVWSLLQKKYPFTILSLSMFFIIIIGDVTVFSVLLTKMHKDSRLPIALVSSFLGRYYDRVTPWSIGGEPFQIGYMTSRGVGAGDSCAIAMSRHTIRFSVTAVVVICILLFSGIATEIWVMVVAILSILVGLIVPVFMLICAFKPKIGFAIGRAVLHAGHKIKIVKDYEKAEKKMLAEVEKFLSGLRFISANKSIILLVGFCAIVELFAVNSVPFLVLKALGTEGIEYWRVFVLCIFITYASSFAPTPGGSGIAELSFYAIFASHIASGQLFWAVLFWRICIFYLPVLIGFIMQTVLSIRSLVTSVKQQKLR